MRGAAPHASDSHATAAANLVGAAFLFGLALSPAIFGANAPLAWGINALVFGVLLTLYAAPLAHTGRPWPVPYSRIRVPALAFAIVLAWIALQTSAGIPDFLADPAWQRASRLLGEPAAGTISVNPGETQMGLLRLATAAAVFVLALELGRDARWAERIVAAVAIAGAAHAVYAMALAAIGPEAAGLVLPASLVNLDQGPGLTGTFINRNHFAIYLGLSLLAAWGLLVRQVRAAMADHGFRGQREALAKSVRLLRAAVRYSLLLVPLTIALLWTGSRAAFFLTLAAMVIMALFERGRGERSSLAVKAALGIIAAGALLGLAARGEHVASKLAGTSAAADLESRLAVGAITLRAIGERPIIGHGYATFADVFPLYRDDTLALPGKWLEAHNSYLEAVLGLGLPVAVLLFIGLGTLVLECLKGALHRKRDRLAPVVAVGATLVLACHALVDFSIQLQGIALSYAALLGAGYAQSWTSREL